MTINTTMLINHIGMNYLKLRRSGLIPYKAIPRGFMGNPVIRLCMRREGIVLSFRRHRRILRSVTLQIQNDSVKNWVFPGELPRPLKNNMSRQWMHDRVGYPVKSAPPKKNRIIHTGWTDLFCPDFLHNNIFMEVHYDLTDNVKTITFIPFNELNWGVGVHSFQIINEDNVKPHPDVDNLQENIAD